MAGMYEERSSRRFGHTQAPESPESPAAPARPSAVPRDGALPRAAFDGGRAREAAAEPADTARVTDVTEAAETMTDAAKPPAGRVTLQELLANGKHNPPDWMLRPPFLIPVQGGKKYLIAEARIYWFRSECGFDYGIETFLLEGGTEAGIATVQTKIYGPDGRLISSGIKTETKSDFPAGWVEKAETGSIARALSNMGFGTLACGLDLDDGKRPADSPKETGRSDSSRGSGTRGTSGSRAIPPGAEIWEGPDLCPKCHAPEGKKHGKQCLG